MGENNGIRRSGYPLPKQALVRARRIGSRTHTLGMCTRPNGTIQLDSTGARIPLNIGTKIL
jgi:hypothetical protein